MFPDPWEPVLCDNAWFLQEIARDSGHTVLSLNSYHSFAWMREKKWCFVMCWSALQCLLWSNDFLFFKMLPVKFLMEYIFDSSSISMCNAQVLLIWFLLCLKSSRWVFLKLEVRAFCGLWDWPWGLFLLQQMPLHLENQTFIFNNIEGHHFVQGREEKERRIKGIQVM